MNICRCQLRMYGLGRTDNVAVVFLLTHRAGYEMLYPLPYSPKVVNCVEGCVLFFNYLFFSICDSGNIPIKKYIL